MSSFCPWEPSQYLVFSSNVPELLFYSHLTAIIASIILGLAIFLNNKKSAVGKILFYVFLTFSIWAFVDMILWATNDPRIVMFFWSSQILIEIFIFILCFFLVRQYVGLKSLPNKTLVLGSLFLVPFIFIIPTAYNLVGVDITYCNAIENPITIYYTYTLEVIIGLSIIRTLHQGIKKNIERAREIRLFGFGIMFFILAFVSGNIIGSITGDWDLAQYGLFGMPIFVSFLTYLIVKYQAFNIKLLGTQALVVGLAILIGSQFFFIRNQTNIILNSITFIAVLIFGNFLVKSVKREVEQRERLQALTNELATANTKLQSVDKLKTEFLSLASHQLRSPLTAIKGYSSMLLEGSFGAMTLQQKEAIDRVFQSVSHLTKVVNDLLNVSKIEQGGMVYTKANYDFGMSVKNVADELRISAKNKNLALDYEDDARGPYMINGDEEKIRQVVINLIDNSIKYTPEGSINVRISKQGSKVLLAIKDTGMGMTEEIRQTLFKKFARGEGGKVNTSGSGLGLYLAKEISEAHHGRVWVESPGPGKGSTFFVEFELVKGV